MADSSFVIDEVIIIDESHSCWFDLVSSHVLRSDLSVLGYRFDQILLHSCWSLSLVRPSCFRSSFLSGGVIDRSFVQNISSLTLSGLVGLSLIFNFVVI